MLKQQKVILAILTILTTSIAVAENITAYGMISSINTKTYVIEVDGYEYNYGSFSQLKNKNGYRINFNNLDTLLIEPIPVKYKVKDNDKLISLSIVSWHEYNQAN